MDSSQYQAQQRALERFKIDHFGTTDITFQSNVKRTTLPNGDKYHGQMAQGVPEGYGILNTSAGQVYFGHFSNGVPHGQGTVLYQNGDIVEGIYQNGQFISQLFTNGAQKNLTSNGNVNDYNQLAQPRRDNQIANQQQNKSPQSIRHYQNATQEQIQAELIAQNQDLLQQFRWQVIVDTDGVSLRQSVRRVDLQQGDVYEGETVNGQIAGKGHFHYGRTGDFYIGEWEGNSFHGRGIYCFANGERYQGDFVYGKKSGQGKYFYKNGDRYEGDWVLDKKQGNGTFFDYSQQLSYRGPWSNGFKNGTFTVLDLNGYIQGTKDYEMGTEKVPQQPAIQKSGGGRQAPDQQSPPQQQQQQQQVLQNVQDAQSASPPGARGNAQALLMAAGSPSSSVVSGQKRPRGVNEAIKSENARLLESFTKARIDPGATVRHIDFNNGCKYYGHLVSTLPDGLGIYYFADQSVYFGNFKVGEFHGNGVYTFPNGERYEGDFQHGMKYGYGLYLYWNGSHYRGDWANNKRHGFGTYYNAEKKQKYEGYWQDGYRSGHGKVINENGQVIFDGIFINDKPAQGR